MVFLLTITRMLTVRKVEFTSDSFNTVGVCTSENQAQKYATELLGKE